MLTCPWCKKKTPGLDRECPSCHADLSLLVEYVQNLALGLVRADQLTRAGRLGDAVWAYLEVLEVDPENPVARKQVAEVATAVRQFDQSPPTTRWLSQMRKGSAFRSWFSAWGEEGEGWARLVWIVVVLVALFVGYLIGQRSGVATRDKADRSTPPVLADR
jgi:hypothetical protein